MTLQEQIRSNRLRTALVLLGFAVLTAALVLVIAAATTLSAKNHENTP